MQKRVISVKLGDLTGRYLQSRVRQPESSYSQLSPRANQVIELA